MGTDNLFGVWFDVLGVGFREKIMCDVPSSVRMVKVDSVEGETMDLKHRREDNARRRQIEDWGQEIRNEFINKLLGDDK